MDQHLPFASNGSAPLPPEALLSAAAAAAADVSLSQHAGGHPPGRRPDATAPSATVMLAPLLRRFCEDLVAEAIASVRQEFPDVAPPAIDWQRVQEPEGGGTPEEAAGHAAVVAHQIASEILEWKRSIARGVLPEAPSPPSWPAPPSPLGAIAQASPPPPPSPPPPAGLTLQGAPTPAPPESPPPWPAPPTPPGAIDPAPPSPPRSPPSPPRPTPPAPPLPTPPPGQVAQAPLPGEPEGAAEGTTDIALAGGAQPAPGPAARSVEWLSRRNKRLRRAFVAFGWMRDIGLIMVAFAAWQVWGTSIVQGQSQQALRQQFQAHVHVPAPTASLKPAAPTLISADTRVAGPHEGSVVGYLQIPAIGVAQYVVEGTAESDLAKGPGHYLGTSMPGQAGNVAIAGHRTTYGAPFSDLDHLKIGDQILLTSDAGTQFTYLVTQSPVAVSPREVAVLNTVNDNRLTLTTCNPRYSASQRLVVVALLSQPQSTVVAPPVVRPREVRVVVEPSGWNTRYLPIVLVLMGFLIVLGLANRRARAIYGSIGRILVVAPIWVAGLLFLFESLTKLLPVNL